MKNTPRDLAKLFKTTDRLALFCCLPADKQDRILSQLANKGEIHDADLFALCPKKSHPRRLISNPKPIHRAAPPTIRQERTA